MTSEIEFNTVEWVSKGESIHTDSIVPVWSASLYDKYPTRTFYATSVNHM